MRLATGASIATVILMWLSAASVYFSPENHGWLGVWGLFFPIFAVGNAFSLVSWLLIHPKRAFVPIIGFLCCFSTLRAYCPLNFPSSPPKNSIKVLSFNTMTFGFGEKNAQGKNGVLSYIENSHADIACLQEAEYPGDWDKDYANLKKRMPYSKVLNNKPWHTFIRCISRYPIIGTDEIEFKDTGNGAGIFKLLLAPKDTLYVINVHLQSDGFSPHDKTGYKEIVINNKTGQIKTTFISMLRKLSAASRKRGEQTDLVTKYIDRHEGKSIILCGDFNDSPVSYVHHELSKRLKDAYVGTANGAGFSYDRDGILVRIDNILYSSDWKPYGAIVDRSIKYSDHYPIYTFFTRQNK